MGTLQLSRTKTNRQAEAEIDISGVRQAEAEIDPKGNQRADAAIDPQVRVQSGLAGDPQSVVLLASGNQEALQDDLRIVEERPPWHGGPVPPPGCPTHSPDTTPQVSTTVPRHTNLLGSDPVTRARPDRSQWVPLLCHLWGVCRAPGGQRGAIGAPKPMWTAPNLPRAAKSRRSSPVRGRRNNTAPTHGGRTKDCYLRHYVIHNNLFGDTGPPPTLVRLRMRTPEWGAAGIGDMPPHARTPHPAHSAGVGGHEVVMFVSPGSRKGPKALPPHSAPLREPYPHRWWVPGRGDGQAIPPAVPTGACSCG